MFFITNDFLLLHWKTG